MGRMMWMAMVLTLGVVFAGCKSQMRAVGEATAVGCMVAGEERAIAREAALTVQVWHVDEAVSNALAWTVGQGGHVESRMDGDGSRLVLRVPDAVLTAAVAEMETLGRVTSRSFSAEDVTEQRIDGTARLQNLTALRDRLRALLEKAVDVKDVLAIETELTRVQTEIDAATGRLKAVEGSVALSRLTLDVESRPIPGPVGLVFQGIGWVLEKLFVLNE